MSQTLVTRLCAITAVLMLAGCAVAERDPAATGVTLASTPLHFCDEPPCSESARVIVRLDRPVVVSAPDETARQHLQALLDERLLAPLYFGERAASTEALAQAFIRQHRDGPGRWHAHRTWRQTEFSSDLWSLVFKDEVQNFSRPPYLETRVVHFNPQTGEPVSLAYFFDETSLARLRQMAETVFQESYGSTSKSGDEAIWRFPGGRFALPDDFSVSEAGITFLWDQYEIGPGAAGSQQVHLGWRQLTPLLREGVARNLAAMHRFQH